MFACIIVTSTWFGTSNFIIVLQAAFFCDNDSNNKETFCYPAERVTFFIGSCGRLLEQLTSGE